MHKMWLSSVVAGLLVLAPVAAIAQSGLGDDPEETEVQEVVTEEATGDASSGTEVLQQEQTTDTVDDGEGDGDTGLDQEETTDTGEDGDDPAGESNDHGERVSTVARCAPTGKLDIEGFSNHGAFVRAVAHGETIEVDGETYDLSTAEGVEALCAWAETYEPQAESASTEGQQRGRPEHAGPPDDDGASDEAEEPGAVEPEETADADEDSDGEDADGGPSRGGGNGNGQGGGNGNGPGHVGVR